MYEASASQGYAPIEGYFPLPISEYSNATIKVKLAGNVKTVDWEEITIIKNKNRGKLAKKS